MMNGKSYPGNGYDQSHSFGALASRARNVPIEDEIARRGVTLRGNVDRCGPCPKCGGDDRFSINIAKQLFNCRGCDTGGDVIDLVQHLDGVDFTTACSTLTNEPAPKIKLNGKKPTNGHSDNGAREVAVAKYVYKDENGAALFTVGRFEYQNADGSFVLKDGKHKKTFKQKRPDPTQPGKWIYNVNGVPSVPYRLPELLEANERGKIILIVEGEAKADLLWSWGIPATCCAMGAGKWKAAHSEFLNGSDVVIVPDNDEPGRDHANAIAASLHDIATSVRILELPNLEPKEDVIDWAKRGGDKKQLNELIATQARRYAPSPAATAEQPAAPMLESVT